MTSKPQPPQKRIPLMAGVPSRDYGLMQGANGKAKRNPDGSQQDSQGDEGAFQPDSSAAAFPSAPEAFPGSGEGQ